MIEEKNSLHNYLDLRGIACPTNYIRSCLAIEDLNDQETIIIDLDKGEPYLMVQNGLSECGHKIKIISDNEQWVRLSVLCCVK